MHVHDVRVSTFVIVETVSGSNVFLIEHNDHLDEYKRGARDAVVANRER